MIWKITSIVIALLSGSAFLLYTRKRYNLRAEELRREMLILESVIALSQSMK